MTNFPLLRESTTCPLCLGLKEPGPLTCATCHAIRVGQGKAGLSHDLLMLLAAEAKLEREATPSLLEVPRA